MHGGQLLVGVAFAYGIKFTYGPDAGSGAVDLKMVGMLSALFGGALALLWAWIDIRRLGPSFRPQIGLGPGAMNTSHAVGLVLSVLGATHFLAWVYRSVILPLVGHEGIIGGGSQMFAHIRDTGSVSGMAGFLLLALVVGPVMEEVIFRGYLQSALAQRMPTWAAVLITSLLFMAGHGPMVLWPMYFLYAVAWGWILVRTKSLKMASLIHVLSNLFYTVVATMGWDLLA